MFPARSNRIYLLSLYACLFFFGCENHLPKPKDYLSPDRRFRILIAGEGIPVRPTSEKQIYPLNRSEAAAMERGASLAYSQSPSFAQMRKLAVIVRQDDRGTEEQAGAIANLFQYDPLLLAVIGHSSSGTTGTALSRYQNAGIPVIMPIATSPETASATAFRLPLNDRDGQAPALVDFITANLQAKKVHLIKDVTQDAKRYTEPLTDFVTRLLPSEKFGWADEVSAQQTDFSSEARKIMVNGPDVVLFVGYASTAVLFMDALDNSYGDSVARPKIVLTDGSLSEDLRPRGFEMFISAPFPEVDLNTCRSPEVPIYQRRFKAAPPNFEALGFDAMLVLNEALELCVNEGIVSRGCLLRQLRASKFRGLCNDYYFKQGENQEGHYSIFKVSADSAGAIQFRTEEAYSAERLKELKKQLSRSTE